MSIGISHGYLSVFKPPYTLTHTDKRSTIYCISTDLSEVLVLIPLVPNFFADVYQIVTSNAYSTYIFFAPDVSLPFVSDYYLSWDLINRQFHRECKIFSKFPIENYGPEKFKEDVKVAPDENVNITIPFSQDMNVSINVTLTQWCVQASNPFACNVMVEDTRDRILFVQEMNDRIAQWILDRKSKFSEIHMPYIQGNYDGWSYHKTLQEYPALVDLLRVTHFASIEEYDDARARSAKIGRRFDAII